MQRRNYISESHNEKFIVLAGINVYIIEFYCFTVHFNSLNLTYQLMHFHTQ